MFVAYWAVKGGAGASVVAAAHALVSGAESDTVLVDLDGDQPALLGIDEPGAGVADWLRAGDEVPIDALDRLLVPIAGRTHLLPRGHGPLSPDRAALLATLLRHGPRRVVIDAGTRPVDAAATLAMAADRSILVTRSCYLAMRRVASSGVTPTEIVLVEEPERALAPSDVATVCGAPVRTRVRWDPAIARSVDAGLLARRLPRRLHRSIAALA